MKKKLQSDQLVNYEPFMGYSEISNSVRNLAPTECWNLDTWRAFSVLFTQIFVGDTPNYEIRKGVFGATRSNWTYHTAMAMAQAAKMMNLTCKVDFCPDR